MDPNTKEERPKPRNYCSGIIKLPPRPPKSAEEIQAAIDEVNDRQFDPHVKHGGRNGNIVQPLD